jgi:SAM-dependent methyltransferase
MKQLPESKGNYGRFWRMLMGAMPAEILMSAVDMGIFDLLDEFRSAAEVAQRLETHPDNTRRFLDSLVTVDLLEKRNGLYRNLPDTADFLMRGTPLYLGDLLRFSRGICVNPLKDLPKLLREGPAPGPGIEDENLWAEACRSNASWVFGEMGRTMAGIISDLDGFPGFEKMLDLGGGHGIFTLYFVQAHPSMTGVVFDRPPIARVAGSFIEEYGMTERVSIAQGDYLTDDIGSGYDLIWASCTLNFARQELDSLLTKIYAALKPGGYFAAFQDGLTHEHTKPDITLGFLPAALQSSADFGFDRGEIAKAMSTAGFRSVRSRSLDTPMGTMDLDIARR